jgi:hypothetical protein
MPSSALQGPSWGAPAQDTSWGPLCHSLQAPAGAAPVGPQGAACSVAACNWHYTSPNTALQTMLPLAASTSVVAA